MRALLLLLLSVATAQAATIAQIGNGLFTSNGSSVSPSGWGTDVASYLCVTTAYSAGPPSSHTVSGGGVTWVQSGVSSVYQSRRAMFLYEAQDGATNLDVPDGTSITITAVGGGGTYQETHWWAFEVAEHNGGIAQGPDVQNSTGTSPLSTSDLGTVTADEITIACIAAEDGTATVTADTGNTLLGTTVNNNDNVRQTNVVWSTTDNTPGFAFTAGGAGITGIRMTDGAIGAHSVGGGGTVVPIILQQH